MDGFTQGISKFFSDFYGALIPEDRWLMYLEGLGNTLTLSAIACICGTLIGLIVASVKISAKGSKNPVLLVLNSICELYTTVIRGTPLMVQLLIIYGFQVFSEGYLPSVIGFSLNSGAYVSEIFRGGINSVNIGQTEAGRSLGLSQWQTMRHIVLPQATKNALPALFNEFIVLVKETSVAGYIAVNELTKMSMLIKGRTYNSLPLYISAVLYLVVTILLTWLLRKLERRLARSDRG